MPLARLQQSKPTTKARPRPKPAQAVISQSTTPTTMLPPIVQSKLRLGTAQNTPVLPVSHPGDPLERQADEVANRMMTQSGEVAHHGFERDADVIGDADGVLEEEGLMDGDAVNQSVGISHGMSRDTDLSRSRANTPVSPMPGIDRTIESDLTSRYGSGQPIGQQLRSVVEPSTRV